MMKLFVDTNHCGDDSNPLSWYQYQEFAQALSELLQEPVPVFESGEEELGDEGVILYHANWSLFPDALDEMAEELRARLILLQVNRNDMDELLNRYHPFGLIEQRGYDCWSAGGDPEGWSGLVLPDYLAVEGQSKTGIKEDTPYAMVPPLEGGLPATLVHYL